MSKMSKRTEECTEQSDLPKKRANKTTGRNLPRKYDLKSCQHAIQRGEFECFIEFTAWKYLRLAHPWILPKDLFPIPCEILGCATFQLLRRQHNTISILYFRHVSFDHPAFGGKMGSSKMMVRTGMCCTSSLYDFICTTMLVRDSSILTDSAHLYTQCLLYGTL